MKEERDPVCPNSKCKMLIPKSKRIHTGTDTLHVFIVYCGNCGKIIGLACSK